MATKRKLMSIDANSSVKAIVDFATSDETSEARDQPRAMVSKCGAASRAHKPTSDERFENAMKLPLPVGSRS